MNAVTLIKRPDCDIHTYNFFKPGVPALYDIKTVNGRWAFACEDCFNRYGLGLGLGLGQKILIEGEPT